MGTRYFKCPDNHGAFARAEKVELLEEEEVKPPKEEEKVKIKKTVTIAEPPKETEEEPKDEQPVIDSDSDEDVDSDGDDEKEEEPPKGEEDAKEPKDEPKDEPKEEGDEKLKDLKGLQRARSHAGKGAGQLLRFMSVKRRNQRPSPDDILATGQIRPEIKAKLQALQAPQRATAPITHLFFQVLKRKHAKDPFQRRLLHFDTSRRILFNLNKDAVQWSVPFHEVLAVSNVHSTDMDTPELGLSLRLQDGRTLFYVTQSRLDRDVLMAVIRGGVLKGNGIEGVDWELLADEIGLPLPNWPQQTLFESSARKQGRFKSAERWVGLVPGYVYLFRGRSVPAHDAVPLQCVSVGGLKGVQSSDSASLSLDAEHFSIQLRFEFIDQSRWQEQLRGAMAEAVKLMAGSRRKRTTILIAPSQAAASDGQEATDAQEEDPDMMVDDGLAVLGLPTDQTTEDMGFFEEII